MIVHVYDMLLTAPSLCNTMHHVKIIETLIGKGICSCDAYTKKKNRNGIDDKFSQLPGVLLGTCLFSRNLFLMICCCLHYTACCETVLESWSIIYSEVSAGGT